MNELTAAAERVRRFLDERERPTPFAPQGYLPVNHLGTITRTGDRLLASDLRAILAAVEQAAKLADLPPGDCEGHPCIWPEDIHAALGIES